MPKNKNARTAAQLLARRRPRVNATTTTLGASTRGTTSKATFNMSYEATKRSLSRAQPRVQKLWNPNAGIRFSPEPEATLYPTLDFRRFMHSQETTAAEDGTKSPQTLPPPRIHAAETPKGVSNEAKAALPSWKSTKSSKQTFAKKTQATYTPQTKLPAPAVLKGLPKVEPPLTSLEFNISNELFQAALSQPKDSPGSFWSHTMYRRTAANGTTDSVRVHYCTSKHTMEHVCRKYFLDQPVLGFDLEWVAYAKRGTGPRENVSLIQIASPGRIGLFHVALFPKDDFVSPTFRTIMEDENVRKVGVHIMADCTRLRNYLDVTTKGIFELSHLYKLVKHAEHEQRRKLINKVPVALATQVQELLKLPLFKGQSVRSSNWSKPLDTKQLTYSAADAYAGLQLYHVLEERRLAMDPPPDGPRHAELGLPIPIPPTPEVSDVESDAEALRSDASSEFSDGSIEEVMLELAATQEADAAGKTAAQSAETTVRDTKMEAAEAKIKQLRASRPLRAPPSALRAFYVWQADDELPPVEVAKLLRDPPLQTGTVIGYILDAIRGEKLDFPKDRLQKEVLSLLHPALASGKYRDIVKQCQQTTEAEQEA